MNARLVSLGRRSGPMVPVPSLADWQYYRSEVLPYHPANT